MTRAALAFASLWTCALAFAQPPSDPKYLIPESAPELDYVAVADSVTLPDGISMGAPASVTFDSHGHMWVLNRGPKPIMEFDENGKLIRSLGDGMFRRTHGLRIDPDGNIWVTDVGLHFVVKLSPKGETLLTLGTKGEPGAWDEASQLHHFTEPNDLAFGRNGDVFIVQGHSPKGGDPRVFKFDKDGHFIKTWGGKGTEPGKFAVAHGIAVDAKGLLWVTDRENSRIQVFDQDGNYVREMKYAGLPCGLDIGKQYVYMVNGFTGQLLRLDLDGKVLAAVGKPGKALGEFGEAHFVAVSPKGDIFIADTAKPALHKFVKK